VEDPKYVLGYIMHQSRWTQANSDISNSESKMRGSQYKLYKPASEPGTRRTFQY